MSVTGTIKIVDGKGYIRKLKKFYYAAELKMDLEEWRELPMVAAGLRFIHITVEQKGARKKTIKQKTSDMPYISAEHFEYLKQHTARMKPQAIAKQLGIPVDTVYYYNRELKPHKQKEALKKYQREEEPKKVGQRFPAQYSNSRPYDFI